MLSDEEKEIFNNLKEYMQSEIDKGYHKFIYNDLDWDFKCIDCINAIDKALKQSKEIEELKEKDKRYDTAYNLGKAWSSAWTNMKWNDKIKAKKEELEKQLEIVEKMEASATRYDVIQKLENQITVLQLLLEKEE